MSEALSSNGKHDTKVPSQEIARSGASSGAPSAIGRLGALRFSKRQIVLAIVIAGLSDLLCAFVQFAPPVVWAVDLLTAVLLFAVLGWQWLLLPGLMLEAIPGLGVIPFWLLVVGAIFLWGTARPKIK
jgi:hypothetical protein